MAVWGANIPVVKALTGAMDTIWVAFCRLIVASATLAVLVVVRYRRWPRLSLRQWGWLSAGAFFSIYLNQLLFARGLALSTATNGSLLMALTPSMSLLGGAIAFRDPVRPRMLAGVALGLAGVTLTVLQARDAAVSRPGVGEAIVLLGLVLFVIGGLIVQRIARDVEPLLLGGAIYVAGTAMLCVHAAVRGFDAFPLDAFDASWVWWCVLYSGIVGTGLSNVVWYGCVARIGFGRAGTFFSWLPVFGVAVSALVLGETLTAWHLAGLALVVAGTRMTIVPTGRVEAAAT
jgi:drug/metabolite transporter (DMT)-like permease